MVKIKTGDTGNKAYMALGLGEVRESWRCPRGRYRKAGLLYGGEQYANAPGQNNRDDVKDQAKDQENW